MSEDTSCSQELASELLDPYLVLFRRTAPTVASAPNPPRTTPKITIDLNKFLSHKSNSNLNKQLRKNGDLTKFTNQILILLFFLLLLSVLGGEGLLRRLLRARGAAGGLVGGHGKAELFKFPMRGPLGFNERV